MHLSPELSTGNAKITLFINKTDIHSLAVFVMSLYLSLQCG